MITMPEEIKELYKQDSISKNFRVHFVNGEYRDLVNTDIVSESVIFTESVSSNSMLRFGESEGASIELQTYFDTNITGLTIVCFSEIDISSLSEEIIRTYGVTSDDVPFPYFPVPYGYFIVNSAQKTGSVGIRKIIAYQPKLSEVIPKMSVAPDIELAKLLWGVPVKNSAGSDLSSLVEVRDKLRTSISYLKMYCSALGSCSYLGSPVQIYDATSAVFTLAGKPENVIDNTAKIKLLVCHVEDHRYIAYKVFVRGHKIVFGSNKFKGYSARSDTFLAEVRESKRYVDLPYDALDASANSIYELSWTNNLSLPTLDDFKLHKYGSIDDSEFIYNSIKDDLEDLCKPCVRFDDATTQTNAAQIYYNSSGTPVTTNVSKDSTIYPLGVLCTEQNLDGANFNKPTSRNAISTNSASKYVDYEENTTEQPYFNLGLQNSNLTQRYINLTTQYDENTRRHKVIIDPEALQLEGLEGYTNLSVINQYTDIAFASEVEVNRHIEVFIPTHLHVARFIVDFSSESYSDTEGVWRLLNTMSLPDNEMHDSRYSSMWPYITLAVTASETQFDLSFNDMASPELRRYAVPSAEDSRIYFNMPLIYSSESTIYAEYAATNQDHVTDAQSISDRVYVFSAYAPNYYEGDEYKTRKKEELIENLLSDDFPYQFSSAHAELLGEFLRMRRDVFGETESYSPVPNGAILFPGEDIYPNQDLYPTDSGYRISRSMWRKLLIEDRKDSMLYDKVVFRGKILGEDVVISANVDIERLNTNVYQEYDVSNNWILKNTGQTVESVQDIVNYMASVLSVIQYHKMTMTMRGLPFIQAGDNVNVIDNEHANITCVLRQRTTGIQSLICQVENA